MAVSGGGPCALQFALILVSTCSGKIETRNEPWPAREQRKEVERHRICGEFAVEEACRTSSKFPHSPSISMAMP
jgi:hypothetical protein